MDSGKPVPTTIRSKVEGSMRGSGERSVMLEQVNNDSLRSETISKGNVKKLLHGWIGTRPPFHGWSP